MLLTEVSDPKGKDNLKVAKKIITSLGGSIFVSFNPQSGVSVTFIMMTRYHTPVILKQSDLFNQILQIKEQLKKQEQQKAEEPTTNKLSFIKESLKNLIDRPRSELRDSFKKNMLNQSEKEITEIAKLESKYSEKCCAFETGLLSIGLMELLHKILAFQAYKQPSEVVAIKPELSLDLES